jgi:hypothetical protein
LLILQTMNRRLLTPGMKFLKADGFSFSTSDIPGAFTINGNNVQQTSETATTPFTPGVDAGSITTMSIRGGVAAAPSIIQVQTFRFLTAPKPTGYAAIGRISFPQFRVATFAGAPTQLIIGGTVGNSVVPNDMKPIFLKEQLVPFINNGVEVVARLFLTTAGELIATLLVAAPFTAPFGFDADVDFEYGIF